MNCKQTQELLPLYVGRDLEEKRTRLIATHLRSCMECAGSSAEYEETRRLLQGFAPPTFSEAAYDGIRRQVWREIEREETRAPSLPQLVGGLFRPRLSWAVATALLLAVSLFAFYFIARRGSERREVAVQPIGSPQRPAAIASNSPPPAARENKVPSYQSTEGNTGSAAGDHTRPAQRRRRLGTGGERQTVAANSRAQRSIDTQVSPESTNPAEPGAVDPGAPGKILRVEMQTKDPNIRIIWFSPQRPKQDSPGRFSKGV